MLPRTLAIHRTVLLRPSSRLLSTTPARLTAHTTSPQKPDAPNKAASETTGTKPTKAKDAPGQTMAAPGGDNPEGGVQSKPTRSTGIGNKGQPNAEEEAKGNQ